jgi:hypothetical protein
MLVIRMDRDCSIGALASSPARRQASNTQRGSILASINKSALEGERQHSFYRRTETALAALRRIAARRVRARRHAVWRVAVRRRAGRHPVRRSHGGIPKRRLLRRSVRRRHNVRRRSVGVSRRAAVRGGAGVGRVLRASGRTASEAAS